MGHHGRTAWVKVLPDCDGCRKRKARYDCRTFTGRWGYFCPICWPQVRASDQLGIGFGQYLHTDDDDPIPDWVKAGDIPNLPPGSPTR